MDGRFWVGTSWKMNKTLAEAEAFADALLRAPRPDDPSLVRFVIPPFTAVREVKRRLAGSDVLVGAQTMHWDDSGAWTGEISPVMLRDCGADLVELGHSERRTHFGETDEAIGRKVAAALRHGLVPLVCIGETAAEKDRGATASVLERQVHGALAGVDALAAGTVLLAYEPVWAIGAGGVPASPDYAQAQHALIRRIAAEACGAALPVLYGGSVTLENCAALAARPAIDGLFVGRAAWDAEGYLAIVDRAAAAR
ncbi:MAG: triose-phosphate isomerase [Alphaproteobacteria bacterium]